MSRNWTDRAVRLACLSAILLLAGCGSVGVRDRGTPDESATYPAPAESRYVKALGYMDSGEDARAMDEFEDLRQRYPEYSGPLVNLGIIHGRNGRPDAAMAAFERALTVCSTCAIAHNQLGIEFRKQGRFEEAEQSYMRAIDADPGYKLAYFNLGVLNDLYIGKPDVALRYYRLYVEKETDADSKALVEKWIVDLERRITAAQRTARAEQ